MRNEDITCPYKLSGLCYRDGCIHLPELKCMKKYEFNHIMKSFKKFIKRKKGNHKYER